MIKLIILAAGEGSRLRPYTLDRPKCQVEIQGKSILDWQIDVARQCGIHDIVVVKGYLKEKIERSDVKYYVNGDYGNTNMVASLWCAESEFEEHIIVSYGDILYETCVLSKMIKSDSPVAVAVDKGWRSYWEKRFDNPLSDAESLRTDEQGRILNIGQKVKDISEIQGQFIGLIKFMDEGIKILKDACKKAISDSEIGKNPFGCRRRFGKMFMTDLLQGIIDSGYCINSVPVDRKWLEIDSVSDYRIAQKITERSNGMLRITD